jgi:phospholipid/cholesterol/gamma-HCH transport system ATP-binding protein
MGLASYQMLPEPYQMTNESEKTDAAIIVRDLRRRFGQDEVLRGVSLDCTRGEITTIFGPSGCGKTVLLKHLNLLLRPDSGQITIDGIDVTKLGWRELDKVREKFGMLFQGGALFDSLTVFDNVAFPLIEKTRMSRDEITRRVSEMLRQVGLEAMENKYPSQLSGGMQKRVALARALIHEPKILMLDEPTTGLDPARTRAIHELIRRTQQNFHLTVVMVSHDVPEVFQICDRIAFLHNGKARLHGTVAEVMAADDEVFKRFVAGRASGEENETAL